MRLRASLALMAAAAFAAAVVNAQNPSTALRAGNWEHVGQDPGGTKYSTLDQINTGNVKSLQKAWTFHTGDKTGFFESTPLVVDGTMYVTAQNGVYALDAQTGAQLWKFESDGGTRRGVTYWPGDDKTPARIFGSAQERLIALDAKTGRMVPQFGQGGFVDMGTTMASPASLHKDILITLTTSPVIRAWNARTGARLKLISWRSRPEQQDVGRRLVEGGWRHQYLGLPDHRHRTRHRLRADVDRR